MTPVRNRWIGVVFLVALLVGGFFLVRYLGGTASHRPFAEASIEDNWNRTIKSLGVSPIFPPEEDLVVGDVLAAEGFTDSYLYSASRRRGSRH